MARRRYRVWPLPNSSDIEGTTWFGVQGPGIDEFAVMGEAAAKMERALNATAPVLTTVERDAICTAIGFALAGENDWSAATIAALRRAHAKLGG
jgi:hypothetical protein